jgi:transcriptional antiterminator
MAVISYRLSRLLSELLNRENPVGIEILAESVENSRRTVYRELKSARNILALYDARVKSVYGKGISLYCHEKKKGQLRAAINHSIQQPWNRKERLYYLTLELLSNSGTTQKLYYYAEPLGVTEPTISNDLDSLEKIFLKSGIVLERKPGQGIIVRGTEKAIRHALTKCILAKEESRTNRTAPYSADTEIGILKFLDETKSKFTWMPSDAYEYFRILLMVSVERIRRGCFIESAESPKGAFQNNFSAFLIREIEYRFHLHLPEEEAAGFAEYIHSVRMSGKLLSAQKPKNDLLQSLTMQMIEHFDPLLAPALKKNKRLVKGLSSHLGAALIRIKNKKELPDPLDGLLAIQHPDLYHRSQKAVKVIENYLGLGVNQSEISFIASHFYPVVILDGEPDTHVPENKKAQIQITLENLEQLVRASRELLAGFTVSRVRSDCTVSELMEIAAGLVNITKDRYGVPDSLTKQVSNSSHINRKEEITFIPVSVRSIVKPALVFLIPADRFLGTELNNSAACVILFWSPCENFDRVTRCISGLLPEFPNALKRGDEHAFVSILETGLIREICQICMGVLKI